MATEKRSHQKTTTKRNDLAGAEFSIFAGEEANDDRILKSTLGIAVGFHLVLLLINFPTFTAPEAIEPEETKVYLVQTPIYKPPEIPPEHNIPKERVKRIPVPDPTPDQPEPIRPDEPEYELELTELDTNFLAIPDAPPAPPMPEGPVFVNGDIERPERSHAPQPRYTEVARRARIEGSVIMKAVIDLNGDITELELLKGLPMGLSEESLKTVKQWRFKPATLHGKPIAVYFNLTVHFKLQ